MNPLRAIIEKLKNKARIGMTRIRELGGTSVSFSVFGDDAYKSDIVRACIRAIAEQTSKAEAVTDERNKGIERLLNYRPNIYMNGKDFLYKVRTMYELKNNVFILIMRDTVGNVTGFYPIPYLAFEAYEDEHQNIFIRFQTNDGFYWFSWDDLVVLRKDYNAHDIAGDTNDAILSTLELIHTSNESISNAIKSTANLRGILKSTKGLVDSDDVKAMKEQFVQDFMDPATGDGIGALDSSMDFIPITLSPTITSWETMREFRENVYRYFGVNDEILNGTATPEQLQTFYELKIEPFMIALSRELTGKLFTPRQIVFGAFVRFESATMQFMSMSEKLQLQAVVDRGAMTINEWRAVLNLPPVNGGDNFVRRLDTAVVDDETMETVGDEEEGAES